ncbi:MAG: TetR/AcrR family transcriptional regulator [Spirochaetaceae bacterium]|jgi:AcrR family transcriptional regulator|nr:TetR/AcrR family transcriptional regulator [Spirochaetaceae bacterium]
MSQKQVTPNRQVQRTKGWIFEAIMLLMDEKPYHKITVQDITQKAGIARQTFYRNYDDKDDAVFEYLSNTLKTELFKIEGGGATGAQNNITLIFNYTYMLEQRTNLKKILSCAGLENRIFTEIHEFALNLIAHYRDGLSAEEYHICRYKLVYQITGCLRVLFDWFIQDMPLPADKLFSMLNAMNISKDTQYRSIPNIVVRLKDV